MMEKHRQSILRLGRHHIAVAAAFTVVLNLLFLVTPLYMLQIYDRVLTTGSVPTLLVLSGSRSSSWAFFCVLMLVVAG
ncbi:MAG: hypothetical protein AAFX52_15140 [Pseudomonadota bacterium]